LRSGDLLLEIGAGTGEIGSEIARLHGLYVGLDLSRPMLGAFRRREAGLAAPLGLVVADANATWPITDHSVQAIFGSRSLHLLSLDRVVDEAFRVLSGSGSALVIGRVHRDPQSVKERMRHEMRRLLRSGTSTSRRGENRSRPLIDALVERGAVAFAPQVVARWTTTHSPAESLRNWKSKPGLAGTSVPEQAKAQVLSKLESWAVAEFQNLDRSLESEEEYLLEGAITG